MSPFRVYTYGALRRTERVNEVRPQIRPGVASQGGPARGVCPRSVRNPRLRGVRDWAGRGVRKRTPAGIADKLNEDGVPTAQGGVMWYPSTVGKVLQSN